MRRSRIYFIRKLTLFKRLRRIANQNSPSSEFSQLRSILTLESNPIYITFFKKPEQPFWQGLNWGFHMRRIYCFNEEFLSSDYFGVVRASQIKIFRLSKKRYSLMSLIKTTRLRIFTVSSLIFSYNYMFLKIFLERHFWFKIYNDGNLAVVFNLMLNFRKNRIFLNLQDVYGRNYCFASLGFFIKFFEKRKALKKNKVMKFLLAKFIRKLFTILEVPSANLLVKGIPLNLPEMLSLLNQPLKHKFMNPASEKVVDETKSTAIFHPIRFNYFIFAKNKAFGYVRLKQKGRIKRKLVRKIIKINNVTD